MATRDQQETIFVIVTAPANTKDAQEVLLVLGPTMSITTPPTAALQPQVFVIT